MPTKKQSPGQAGIPAGRVASKAKADAGSALAETRRSPVKANAEIRARTSLKPAGGSLVMIVPAAVRKALGYEQGTELSVSVEHGRMIIEAVEPMQPRATVRRPKYTLDELLNQADPDAPVTEEELAWQTAAPVGRETW